MSRERVKVEIEAITGEERDAARGQALLQGVNHPMGQVLRAGAELQHRQNFRAGINGQPEPEHLSTAAEPCAQFIQLHVRELEVGE